uniref:sensor domain-containing diguanylate cyclase n=1 Tax=Sulfurovum sp. TaxID=1969726 RepID=UPI0028681E7A
GTVQDITEDFEKEEALLLQAQIFDAVQDSIMVHDLEGHFIYLNENAWKTRGYTQEEMMGMTVKELDAPEYDSGHPEMIKAAMKKMGEERHINLQVEQLCKNGERIPVEVYAKRIILKDKPYILSSVRDISEQKKARQALLTSEKKYRDLVEDMMIGIYRADLFGNIFYVNPALVKMLAFDTEDEMTKLNALKMYKSTKQQKAFTRALLKEGHINNYELEVLNKNGAPVPVMMTATLDGDIFTGMIVDMSEIKRSRQKIETLSKVVEQIDDLVIITDKMGTITYVNQAFCDHTGFSKKEVLGKDPKLLKSGQHDNAFYKDLWETISSGEVFRKTLVNKKKNNDLYYENKTITPLKNDENNIIGYVSTGKDVTSETLMHKEMENIATFDKLTGIYNRYKFEELYELESERSQRFSQPLSLILIDIDHFKLVNDTYGHTVGDEVLKKLAAVIQNNIRKIDIFARWGGEEFLVLSPGTDLENIQILAEKLRLAVESALFPGVDHLTISLGVGALGNNDTFLELFKRVDQGLYYAKEHGRNQIGIISTL